MKHITKNADPLELLNWKKSDKIYLKGVPKWERIKTPIKEAIRKSLREEQGYICCYCERYMQENDYHIEHIKPKGIAEYEPFLAEYDNLICSCQFEEEKGAPRHCGNSKGSWYDDGLFISPLDPGCEARFKYTYDGLIEPANADDNAAKTTITKLQLDIEKLNALRSSTIEPFLDDQLSDEEIKEFAQGYLVDKNHNGGKFNEFYTTIKYLFA